ncbi:hypothetical protein HK101_004926 [Irineochytrium annulatum]|nr:hypothetical protein HK101_004926 [Irineochytrium annulatum]
MGRRSVTKPDPMNNGWTLVGSSAPSSASLPPSPTDSNTSRDSICSSTSKKRRRVKKKKPSAVDVTASTGAKAVEPHSPATSNASAGSSPRKTRNKVLPEPWSDVEDMAEKWIKRAEVKRAERLREKRVLEREIVPAIVLGEGDDVAEVVGKKRGGAKKQIKGKGGWVGVGSLAVLIILALGGTCCSLSSIASKLE